MAAAAGASVRLTVPVPGDDLLTPFLDRVPPAAPAWPRAAALAALPGRQPPLRAEQPGLRRRPGRWDLDSWSDPHPGRPGTADGGRRAGLRGPRHEPRNLTFADGLDHWVLADSFTENAIQSHWQDYSAADHGRAVLSSAGLFLQVMKPRDVRGPFTAEAAWPPRGTTSSPSRTTPTGPRARSPRRSQTTRTPSRSASSWPALAGSSCAARS